VGYTARYTVCRWNYRRYRVFYIGHYYGAKGNKNRQDRPPKAGIAKQVVVAKKEKEMKEFFYVFGAPIIVGLIVAAIGFYEMWRERH
jgi:hypothetical protein